MRLNVGVIFGGRSVEHEISIISAIDVMAKFDDKKYKVVPIYIDKDNNWYTGEHLKDILHYRDIDLVKRYAKKVSLVKLDKSFVLQSQGLFKKNICVIDVVLPVGHGSFVEDGSLQGYLNMLGVPFVGNVISGAIGQDKVMLKDLLKAHDVPVCNYVWFYDYEYEKDKKKVLDKISTLKYPLYVKPSSLGSSIGITLVKKVEDLNNAIKEAMKFDSKILVEEAVNNKKEVNVSVLGDYKTIHTSEIEEINSHEEFYSFKEKYVEGYHKTEKKNDKTSPLISKEMMEDIKKYAIDTFKIINGVGVSRVDFLIDYKERKIFVNEINTVPGDLAMYLWMAKKTSASDLIDHLINIAIEEAKRKDRLMLSLPGNLLEGYDRIKGNKLKK